MKVYILTLFDEADYRDYIIDVFNSEELAKDYIKLHPMRRVENDDPYDIIEKEVLESLEEK